ncbi:unnamed protein product [Clavelina lepadiformis]|uniref:tRNA (uracil-O(2)-)-methyltransferase n=1 Tax=Clavelina lepadiformis TaxID=159417 RepID=A0ABP0G301_CLALP
MWAMAEFLDSNILLMDVCVSGVGMYWDELSSLPTAGEAAHFQNALRVWIDRPNVCNKMISCSKTEDIAMTTIDGEAGNGLMTSDLKEFVQSLPQITPRCSKCGALTSCVNFVHSSEKSYFVRKLVPRRPDCYLSNYELVLSSRNSFLFVPLQTETFYPDHVYDIYVVIYGDCDVDHVKDNSNDERKQSENSNFLSAYSLVLDKQIVDSNKTDNASQGAMKRACYVTSQWVSQKLLPTLSKWCDEESAKLGEKKPTFPPSLSLIDKEKYTLLYNSLKFKYGREISKIWPEVTDPQKYVYEDVAIAAYLLVLWEQEREESGKEEKQSFIDLGCGNGLLVHLLTSEGHPGKGVDIRRRKIWSIYGSETDLEEATVTPDNLTLVSGYDWLLGNHSDELTPWIPVMAMRSNYDTRYWVLPCCFFDFYGKYERTQSTVGQYEDYLMFVASVGKKCGFDIQEDVMRIPSTKRVCMVGMGRSYREREHSAWMDRVNEFTTGRRDDEFAARPREERVRNCTKIDRGIQHTVVMTISNHLLKTSRAGEACRTWNRGGELKLSDAVELLSDSLRSNLKNECGGLQTLLRNYNQVFEISAGSVQLRDWSVEERAPRKRKRLNSMKCLRTKPCWFEVNHPDGCPRSAQSCTFLHHNETK